MIGETASVCRAADWQSAWTLTVTVTCDLNGLMTIRVVQWATGGVGKAAIEGVLAHPDLELVGAWVHSESKNGKDVGELVGLDPIGVRATTSMDEILALDADCVVYSPLLPNEDEVVALLRSGKNVVTPVGWVYPDLDNCRPSSTRAPRVEARCTAPAFTRAASPSGSRSWSPL